MVFNVLNKLRRKSSKAVPLSDVFVDFAVWYANLSGPLAFARISGIESSLFERRAVFLSFIDFIVYKNVMCPPLSFDYYGVMNVFSSVGGHKMPHCFLILIKSGCELIEGVVTMNDRRRKAACAGKVERPPQEGFSVLLLGPEGDAVL